jgi:cytochrome c-type biogenesis protein CcmH/NrfG
MKKQETVEVKYIKLSTAMLIGFIALVVGFIGGNVYSVYKGGPAVSRAAMDHQMGGTPGRTDRIAALENEVKSNPGNKLAWVELGNLYFDGNRSKDAIRAYKAYIELDPGNAHVWTDLGVMYRRSGSHMLALDAFDQAIRLDPSHEQSRFNKGVVLFYDMKDKEAARKAWEGLAAVNPLFRTPSGKPLQELIEETK